MINLNKYAYNYFLFLFSIIPITIIVGSAASFVNIVLIDLSFIILLIYRKNFYFLKNKTIILLLILYVYLIFNSFISIDYSESFLRNLGFLRIIILFVAFNYFYYQKNFLKTMFKLWLLIILIVIFDVFVEYFYGKNILGYNASGYGNRIVSFFKDEPIVGGFLNGFFLILTGFFLNQKKKYRYYIFPLVALFFISILVTTERSTGIKAFIGISVFFLLYKEVNFKNKVLSLLLIFVLFFIFISSVSSFHKIINRYTVQILSQKNIYFNLYESGFQVFKNNKTFGVGNKNYRVATCDQDKTLSTSDQNKDKYICNTHPHQIYFELLSEHGLIGTIIILLIFYNLIFSKIKKTISEKNYLKIGSLIYLMLFFLPILPSGAFFSSFSLTLFAINLSIFYASDEDMNVFKINQK
jgi:O-antigen ligase